MDSPQPYATLVRLVREAGDDPFHNLPSLEAFIGQERLLGDAGIAGRLERTFAQIACASGWYLDRAERFARRLVRQRESWDNVILLVEILELQGKVGQAGQFRKRAVRLADNPLRRALGATEIRILSEALAELSEASPTESAHVLAAVQLADVRQCLRALAHLHRRYSSHRQETLRLFVEEQILTRSLKHRMYLGTAHRIARRRVAQDEYLPNTLLLARILLLRGRDREGRALLRRARELRDAMSRFNA